MFVIQTYYLSYTFNKSPLGDGHIVSFPDGL